MSHLPSLYTKPITIATLDDLFAHHRAGFGGHTLSIAPPEPTPTPAPAPDPANPPAPAPAPAPTPNPDVPEGFAVDAQGKSLGFPKDTPVKDMPADQQAAYFRHQNGKQQQRAEGWQKVAGDRTPEQVAADLARLAELDAANMTASEKAVADAEAKGRADALTSFAPKMARLAFQGHFAHLPAERATVILDSIDLTQVIDADTGDIDTDKVRTIAETLAPKSGKDQSAADYGNGPRPTKPGSGLSAGADMFNARKGKTP